MRVHSICAFDDNYIWAIETNTNYGVIIVDPGESSPVFEWLQENSKTITQPVQEGERFSMAGVKWEVMETPGHTLDHISFYTPGFLFCGDTLFSGGCGRMFEGTPEQFSRSLLKLRQLPGDTRVFCAHEYTQANLAFAQKVEPNNATLKSYAEKVKMLREQNEITLPSTLQLELAINPFLRLDQKTVIEAASEHSGSVKNATEDVFYTIRQWKDNG